MKFSWTSTKWGKIFLHVAAWMIVFSLPYLLSPPYDPHRPAEPDREGFFYVNIFTGFFWAGLFYLNAYILTPTLVYKKKYLLYTVTLLVVYCSIMLFHGIFFSLLVKARPFSFFRSASFNVTTFFLTIASSIIFRMMQDKSKTDKIAQQKQEENLKSELSFLRSQISPHFVFNVLNNIVALIRLKSDQLEPTVMKLSSLMQYMLYETDEEKVMLQTEAEYLQSYIDLQQQRFGSKVKLNISIEINDKGYTIEPMLMIPFVENAFKHGVGRIDKPQIDICLQTKENTLYFTVRNKYNEINMETKDKTSGIGLMNVKRRLNLLYGNQHKLSITHKDEWFSVSLQLNLH